MILGPRLEAQLTEALAISSGDVSTLWSEPVAVVVYVVIAAALVFIAGNAARTLANRNNEKKVTT